MSQTLTPPETYEEFRSTLFEQVYPKGSLNKHFDIVWQSHDSLQLTWYGNSHSVLIRDIWDARAQVDSPIQAVLKWAESHIIPPYAEALENAVPVLNVALTTWEFGIFRNQELRILPAEEADEKNAATLRSRCLERLSPAMFTAEQQGAIVAVSSLQPQAMPHCAALYESTILQDVLSPIYDFTESTRFLVYSSFQTPVLVGHESAINRLSDGMDGNYVILDPTTLANLG